MARTLIHMMLHFAVPLFIAGLIFKDKNRVWKAWIIMILTMAVDADHLLAQPIFDPCRCSIGFHPLHSYTAILVYALACFMPLNWKIKAAAAGLLIHMGLDAVDCLFM